MRCIAVVHHKVSSFHIWQEICVCFLRIEDTFSMGLLSVLLLGCRAVFIV